MHASMPPSREHPAEPNAARQTAGVATAGDPPNPWRVALVHDWLTGMRGGEKVLEALCEMYPDAEVFTLVHVPGSVSPAIEKRHPRTSIVQRLPWGRRQYRRYLPLFPFAVEQFDLDRFDLVISSSHCAAKAVLRPGRARHLCYCHTPMRYAWDQFEHYFGAAKVGRIRSRASRAIMAAMARWDAATASRVDRFVANSAYVARRIRRYYNRDASVVYPPVDTDFFHPDGSAPGASFLIVSALVPYKRLDLAISACQRVGVPLRIVGTGPEVDRLRYMAGTGVAFLGYRTNEEIRQLYRESRGMLLPGEEDFGIAPVEAQACGRPVVALARGGALETITDGVSGVLVEGDSAEAFAAGIERVRRERFDPAAVRQDALRFSRHLFVEQIRVSVNELMEQPAESVRW